MALSENLQQILNRIEKGQHTHEDIAVLRKRLLVKDSQVLKQLGKYNVNIGAVEGIHIGDRTYSNPK